MQTASFKIWTPVTVSISNDDKHYTTRDLSFMYYFWW